MKTQQHYERAVRPVARELRVSVDGYALAEALIRQMETTMRRLAEHDGPGGGGQSLEPLGQTTATEGDYTRGAVQLFPQGGK